MNRTHRPTLCRLAPSLGLLLATAGAHAATTQVTTTVDDGSGTSPGSLSYAIATSNASAGGDPAVIAFQVPAGSHMAAGIALASLSVASDWNFTSAVYFDSSVRATASLGLQALGDIYFSGAQLSGGVRITPFQGSGPGMKSINFDASSSVVGAQGAAGASGGAAILDTSLAGWVVNRGSIKGGDGGQVTTGPGGAGGVGIVAPVDPSGGSTRVLNYGTIQGGAGGAGSIGAQGAAGNALTGSIALENHGLVQSGAAGLSAAAISGNHFSIVNDGTIRAHAGSGGFAAAAIVASGYGSIVNAGTISGVDLGGGNYGTAISFTQSGNVLHIAEGSVIHGNVVSQDRSGTTLEVGGDADSVFDMNSMGALGSAAQYQNIGRLTKYGTGTMTLVGNQTGPVSWSLPAGTVHADSRTLEASSWVLGDAATLVIDQAFDATLATGLSAGGGTIVKQGAGTLTLSAPSNQIAGSLSGLHLLQGGIVLANTSPWNGNIYAYRIWGRSGSSSVFHPGGDGGVGVEASPGTTIVNEGTISGGNGADAYGGYAGGSGAAGTSGSGYRVTNRGVISGGNGGAGSHADGSSYLGSSGTAMTGVTTLINEAGGYIRGGYGVTGYPSAVVVVSSPGGQGIATSYASITNAGQILGGGGGGITGFGASVAGRGGDGIHIHDSTVVNETTGEIAGGNGGNTGAAGGVGLVATGNTRVVNAGRIHGGTDTWGTAPATLQSDAIHFTGRGNTLELHAGSVLTGKVTSAGGDAVILGAAGDTSTSPAGSSDVSVFSGFDSFRKIGGGTWILIGSGRLATTGSVEAGTLLIGDATHTGSVLSGDVRVAGGAALGGTGRIDGTVRLDVGASLLPGLGVGALVVACDLSLLSGAQMVFTQAAAPTVSSNGHAALQVVGRADVQGGVSLDLAAGAYRMGGSYTLLEASQGVTGRFESVTLSPGYSRYVDAVVAYAPSSVSIAFAPTAAAYNDHAASYANTVSAALDSTFQTILGDIDTDPGERREDARSGVWAQGVHNEGTLGGDDQSVHGGAVGGGVAVGEGSVLGIAVAGANTETISNLDRVKAKPLGAFGYGVFNSGAWRLAASVGGGHLKQTTTRRLSDVGLSTSADSTGRFYGAAARLDYRWTPDRFAIAPFVQASYLNSRYGNAGEDGAGMLDLSYGKLSQKLTRYEGGVRVSASFGETASFVPWMQVGAVGWTGDRRAAVDETIGGFTQRVSGTGLPSSATAASAGVNLVSGAWRFGLAYKGTFCDDYHAHGGSATAEYHW